MSSYINALSTVHPGADRRPPEALRRLRKAIGAVLLVTLATSAAAEVEGIHVSGNGEITVVPDMARISFSARREGSDAAPLKAELDSVTAKVLALTRKLDIEAHDVTAAGVSVSPRYRRSSDGDSVVDGVVVTRTIAVTLRDLDHISDLIDGALERGVNGVNGVALDASNRDDLEKQALDLAIDNAKAEANQIAARFGVGLGLLLDAGGASAGRPAPRLMAAMAAPERGSFEPGEITISREISATFAIKPPAR